MTKVICIDSTKGGLLTINKVYDILEVRGNGEFYSLIADDGIQYSFCTHRFITMDLHRDNKLNKLIS